MVWYDIFMTTKEKVLQVVSNLPDDASIEDAMDRLLFLAKIERGLQQADAGQTIAHSEVKEKMAKWLK
jgi:predicted transcriptional regulator